MEESKCMFCGKDNGCELPGKPPLQLCFHCLHTLEKHRDDFKRAL